MDRKELIDTINSLHEMEEKGRINGDELAWIAGSLSGLYELCSRYNQFEYPTKLGDHGFTYAKRVVKVNRFVSDKDLEKVDYAFCSGLFVAVEGAFIDRYVMGKYFNKKLEKSAPIFDKDIEELGLPKDLKYNTIRKLSNGQGFVIRNNDFNSYIPHRYNWEYLEI